MSSTRLTFGLMLQGAGSHMNAWRHPSNPADASVNLDFFIRNARKAEENGIAFAFVADQSPGPLLDAQAALDRAASVLADA